MNARTFKSWLKSPTGRFFLMFVILGVVLAVVYLFTSDWNKVEAEALELADTVRRNAPVTIENNRPAYNPPTPKPEAEEKEKPAPATVKQESKPPLSISLFTSTKPTLSTDSAPYGRLIPCELFITVESSRIQTPVVGLVLEDIWHNGRLIIPAGCEVHGTAQADRARNRIATRNDWVIVWTDGTGRELEVQGVGLHMARQTDANRWSITDGSAGLKGTVIKTDQYAELKLFGSTFLSGIAAGLQDVDTIQTDSGSLIRRSEGSLKDAALSGTSAVLNQYAQQVLQRLRQDGFYVRVAAGHNFYLYVTQPLDLAKARVGGSEQTRNQNN